MLTVIKPGMLTTIQDQGRIGYRSYGMPVSGVMDHYAATMANILAGNHSDAAVLEMTMLGGTFRFERDSYVAVCGADMQAKLNGEPVRNWSGFPVISGSELVFQYAVSGCRGYLAVYGGLDVPEVLGSRSTYIRAAIGGLDGRALKTGDCLEILKTISCRSAARELPELYIPEYISEISLRVIFGPQKDLFTSAGVQTLLNSSFTVSARNDRMGILLEGPKVEHVTGPDIISDALCAGAIQVPGDGQPIIMMADCQTTGGYAKIGFVISTDLSKIAQAKAGDSISFVECSDIEAVTMLAVERLSYERASKL